MLLLLLQLNFADSQTELSHIAFLDVRPPVPFRDTSHFGTNGVAGAKIGRKLVTAKDFHHFFVICLGLFHLVSPKSGMDFATNRQVIVLTINIL